MALATARPQPEGCALGWDSGLLPKTLQAGLAICWEMFTFAIVFSCPSRLMWLRVFSVSFQLSKLAAWQRQLPRSVVKTDPSFPPSCVIHSHSSALWSAEAKLHWGILLQFCHSCQLDSAPRAVQLWRGRQHAGAQEMWQWRSGGLARNKNEDTVLAKHLLGILHLAPQIWLHSSCCRSKPGGHRWRASQQEGLL